MFGQISLLLEIRTNQLAFVAKRPAMITKNSMGRYYPVLGQPLTG